MDNQFSGNWRQHTLSDEKNGICYAPPVSITYSVLLPVWNEEKNVQQAIERISEVFTDLKQPFEIIVIDDGSIDATVECIQKAQTTIPFLRLIKHPQNKGKGAAIKTGMAEAKGEVRLFLDCDLSVDPKEIHQALPLLQTNDIVIGSRRIPGSHIAKPQSWFRNLCGVLFNRIIRQKTKLPYRDTQCGFKIFHARTVSLFTQLKTTGWAFDVELLLQANRQQFHIREMPITWRNGKESKVRFRDAWKIWKEIQTLY